MATDKAWLKHYGEEVAKKRKSLGLKQEELALGAGIQHSRIRAIERGLDRAVGIKTQEKIMKFFEYCELHNSPITIGSKNNIQTASENSVISSLTSDISINELVKMAKIAITPEFRKKLDTIKAALGVDEDHAIRVIVEAELRGKSE